MAAVAGGVGFAGIGWTETQRFSQAIGTEVEIDRYFEPVGDRFRVVTPIPRERLHPFDHPEMLVSPVGAQD